jgi:hypothetical protein
MNKTLTFAASGLLAGAALFATATPAMAGQPDVNWSVTIGSDGGYPPPAVVYREPRAVYGPPPVVYVRPAPVYRVAPPVVYDGPAYVYGYRERGHRHEWRDRHDHRHGHRRDRD